MDDVFVAGLLQAREALHLEAPDLLVEAEISLADAEHRLMLRGTGIGVEIDEVGDAGLPDADTIVPEFVFEVERQIGGRLEVVVPTEVVGVIRRLKPVGALPLDIKVENHLSVVLSCGAQVLSPLRLDVEVADFIAQGDELCLPLDLCRFEQVDY